MRPLAKSILRFIVCLIFIVLLTILARPSIQSIAATLPSKFTQTNYGAGGLASPTSMRFAPDGRLFVLEQGGKVRIIKNGTLLSTPFLSVNADSFFERGLLGIAFDPNFATNNFVYLYYTTDTPAPHNQISRFTANGDVAVAGSEKVVMAMDNLSSAGNHNGGDMTFGPDGKLWVVVGNNHNNAYSQSLTVRLGKVLRMNSDGTAPLDNPFYNTLSGANRVIWAYGLRNPFSFAFQPGTGRLHINDVGESTWEEINLGKAGANYGWPDTEGPTTDSRFVGPIYAYQHKAGTPQGCAITNGVFYNPANPTFPASYVGKYFFVDYCGNWIYALDTSNNTASAFATAIASSSVNLQVGPDAALYYLSRGTGSTTGQVFRIQYSAGPTPTPSKVPPSATPTNRQPPVATITLPTSGTHFSGGDKINYAGTCVDPQDGNLPASAYSWEVIFHHLTHTHPFLAPVTGITSGSFTAPNNPGEPSPVIWYRIHLQCTNSAGIVNDAIFDVMPNLAAVTVQSNPPGLQVKVNFIPFLSPHTTNHVVGEIENLSVDSPQTLNGTTYTFSSWSDGGAQAHDFTNPATNTTYTANFTVSGSVTPVSGTSTSTPIPPQTGTITNTYVSDLTWTSATTGFGTIHKDLDILGNPIKIRGTTYTKGIGTHAVSEIDYNLSGNCPTFITDVGVDDDTAGKGTVTFQVWTENGKLYDTGILTGTSPVRHLAVDTTYAQTLRLIVTDGSDGIGSDHADWAGAQLMCINFAVPPTQTPTATKTPASTSTATNTPTFVPTLTVSGLKVFDTTNAAGWSIQSNLQSGNTVYSDRTYTFGTVPSLIQGSTWIETAGNSKQATENPLAQFTISTGATVYVSLDTRVNVPSWMSGWTATGQTVTLAGRTETYHVYSKAFPAGTVALGPNGTAINTAQPNSLIMYLIAVK